MHSEIEGVIVIAMLFTQESCMHAVVRVLYSSAFINFHGKSDRIKFQLFSDSNPVQGYGAVQTTNE